VKKMRMDILNIKDNPLKFKNFRLFLWGHFISFTGTWIQNTAQIWLVYELTKSSFYLGIFSFFNSFPMMIFSLLGGLIIDAFNRKKLLATVVFLGMFPPLILGFLTQIGKINFWYITFLAFLSGCLAALDTPLRQVFISEIVPVDYLIKAISFQSLSFNTARMVGPFLAGLIISYRHLYECFYLNAISFLPLLICLLFFIKPEKSLETPQVKRKRGLRRSFEESFSYLRSKRNLFMLLFSVATFTFFGPSLIVLLPIIVNKFYGGGGKEFGFVSSTIGIGAILGAISVIFRKSIKDKLQNLFRAIILFCIGLTGINWSPCWTITLLSFVLIGFSFTNFFPVANSYVQENTPPELRGRIVSLFVFAFLGIYPVGNFFAGFLAERINLHLILTIYPILLLILNTYLIKLAKIEEKNAKNK